MNNGDKNMSDKQMTMAQLYAFTRDYLEGACGLFEKDPATSEFSRGYQKALMSLKSVLDTMEKSSGVVK